MTHVLLDDPDLAGTLEGDRLRSAQRALIARLMAIDDREWQPDEDAARGGIGLLILEGLLIRRVGADGRFGAELLGPGDVLRPWQHDGGAASLPLDTMFRVVERVLIAELDLAFTARLAAYPEVVGELVGRALQRSRSLAVDLAIAHQRRVEQRLLLLFWHLADRWGRVTPAGVRIPLRLTHQVLADLVVARRPAVSTALGILDEQGLLRRTDEGWLLAEARPADLYRPPAPI